MRELFASVDILGIAFESVLAYLIFHFQNEIINCFLGIKWRIGKNKKNHEENLKAYSGIMPIDHSGYEYKEENITIDDEGISFIIPSVPDGEWYIFDKEPDTDGIRALSEKLKPILSREKEFLVADPSEYELTEMIRESMKEASEYKNNQIEESLFGISRIVLNRKGVAENPWCNFRVYKTDLYTRNVMHILFNKLFTDKHDDAFASIEDIHYLYPFVFELKLSISLISGNKNRKRIILKKAPYEYFEQKDVSDKWLLFASESIGQEDLDEDNEIDLEEAVKRRLDTYNIEADNKTISFHDVFFITEQLSVSVLTSAKVPSHVCTGNEKSVLLDVNGIFDFLEKYGSTTADYCKYSLVMWLSRHCMEKV